MLCINLLTYIAKQQRENCKYVSLSIDTCHYQMSIHIYIYIYTHIYIYKHVYKQIYICQQVCIGKPAVSRVSVLEAHTADLNIMYHTGTRTHTHIHICIYIYIYICTCVMIYYYIFCHIIQHYYAYMPNPCESVEKRCWTATFKCLRQQKTIKL